MKDDTALDTIKGVLFDIDGTLSDSIDMCLAGLGDSFEKFTGSRPSLDFLRSLVGQPLVDQMNLLGLGESDPEGITERVAYAIGRYRVHRGLSRLFKPSVAALHALQDAGISTALVTSKNRQELEEFLAEQPAFGRVDVAVSADHARRPKPFPDPALYACEALKILPEQAVMVGDSCFDMECGRNAGCRLVAVTYGAASRNDLTTYTPEWLLESPEALLDWANELIHHHEKKDKYGRSSDSRSA